MLAIARRAALVVALAAATPVLAEDLTPESWFAIELETRMATVEGMLQRLELLQADPNNNEAQYQQDEETRIRVQQSLSQRGVTSWEHLKWYKNNKAELEAWLNEHPEQRDLKAQIDAQFKTLSEQIAGFGGDQ